ncbi:MAG: integral rane protein [Myxococcales bacterium]|nr:integral rane protein [Myxococcales bacterium]
MRRSHFRLGCLVIALAGCGERPPIQHTAAKTTANILSLAQPSLQQESDYELASRAVPGALKTIEGFYIADDNPKLRAILTEGYCQYATAFVEDEWEVAKFAKKLDDAEYHNARATKMFTRCMNYALMDLGADWEADVLGPPKTTLVDLNNASEPQLAAVPGVGAALATTILAGRPYATKDELASKKVVSPAVYDTIKNLVVADLRGTAAVAARRILNTTIKHRAELMWTGLALGGIINHNLTNVDMISFLSTVKLIVSRVIEIDTGLPACTPTTTTACIDTSLGTVQHGTMPDVTKVCPSESDRDARNERSACLVHLALPHIAFGMILSGQGKAFGGDPEHAAEHFDAAFKITGDRMQLAQVLKAYRVGLQTNDRKVFHDGLAKVLASDPAVWPEQRLANEVAHRRARRYLSHEKDLFQ